MNALTKVNHGYEHVLSNQQLEGFGARVLVGDEVADHSDRACVEIFTRAYSKLHGRSADRITCTISNSRNVSAGRGATWNAAGVIVFSRAIGSALYRVPASGGEITPLTNLSSPKGSGHRLRPTLSSAGRCWVGTICLQWMALEVTCARIEELEA